MIHLIMLVMIASINKHLRETKTSADMTQKRVTSHVLNAAAGRPANAGGGCLNKTHSQDLFHN